MTGTYDLSFKTRPVDFTKLEVDNVLAGMGYSYSVPDYEPTFPNNETDYNAMAWYHSDPKPTWAALLAVWAVIRIRPTNGYPGDLKIATLPGSDHNRFIFCDGREFNKTDYPHLSNKLGVTYGVATTTTKFKVPDYRNRVIVGAGGTYTLGATGGAASATLTASNLPEHNHDLNDAILKSTGSNATLTLLGSGAVATQIGSAERTANAGSASPTAVPTMPPYSAANVFICVGRDWYDTDPD